MHKEIPTKVNAWVDQGVAPLVDALNKFERVMTVDSCQGTAKKPAHVMFRYMGNRAASMEFFAEFGRELGRRAARTCEYEFTLRWLTGHDEPLAELRTNPGSVGRLAIAITSFTGRMTGS